MSQRNKLDLQTLYHNLSDLNDISKEVSNDLKNKNEILKTGYKDCVECKAYIDRSTIGKQKRRS